MLSNKCRGIDAAALRLLLLERWVKVLLRVEGATGYGKDYAKQFRK